MAKHKHNKPCAQHRHSDLWWPSKAHQPVTVTEPPLHGADSSRSTVRWHKTRVQEGGEEEADKGEGQRARSI